MKKQYLEAGRFNGTHGIGGNLKAECWCDSLEALFALKTLYLHENGGQPLHVTRAVPYKDQALLHIEGFDSPEEAAVLKNRVFYAKREDVAIEEGSFFLADLIGLEVYDLHSGRDYGVIKDLSENAASMLYEIETPEGQTVYLPDIPEFVKKIDLDRGVFIEPPKGLFHEI